MIGVLHVSAHLAAALILMLLLELGVEMCIQHKLLGNFSLLLPRIANYKSFTRFHIGSNGDLEVYTLAVDKVPKEWKLDPEWDSEDRKPDSHNK
ncbi:hypothetical protein L3X38_007434 [Prunus dulcis]|uniref:Uncharacterized protein n=1 Tax=Prunus dulcis TaxID=3755 RepID=A0AAD4ZUQ9_PRUDU|nr:hypothetical protein L3X38_007434 [Prunus dulcis]